MPKSVDDILSRPLTTPPTTVEQHIASSVVRRMMATGENSKRRETIQLPTAGQVRYQTINDCFLVQNRYHNYETVLFQPLMFTHVPAACIPSSEACAKTVRRRSNHLQNIRASMSRDSRVQLQAEVKSLTSDERKKLLMSAGIPLDIPPEKGLAMNPDLAIPWNKLRVIRR